MFMQGDSPIPREKAARSRRFMVGAWLCTT